jgi:hypothetical protein
LVAKGWINGAESLTDEELGQVTASGEEIDKLLGDMSFQGVTSCRTEVRYRQHRVELAALPTEELRRRYDSANKARGEAMAADVYDDLPDSFFEAPPKDSSEHIIHELLVERDSIQP